MRHDDPLERSRQIKKRRRVDSWLWLLLGVIVVIVAFFLLVNSSRLAIRGINVSGTRTLPATEVRNLANTVLDGHYPWLIARRNLWFYPRQELTAAISQKFPNIATVTLQITDDHALAITLNERVAVAQWCRLGTDHDCYLVDKTGRLFAVAPQFSDGVFPTFRSGLVAEPLGRKALPGDKFNQLLDLRQQLQATFASSTLSDFSVYQITESQADDYFLTAENGETPPRRFQILISLDSDLKQAATDAAIALASSAMATRLAAGANLEYLDLRFPPKVFYKFQGGI